MKNKSKITGIRQKAQKSVDKSESSIDRFSRFMGVISKGISKDIPSKKTLKKARLFAKNFGGGRSSKVNKALLGGALMLPLVLGQMMSKERSTEELLQTQYGGNEKAMQKDLDEEQKVRDEGLKKVETTADENKDIALDKKKDLQAVSQKGPEEITKSEVNSDDSTLERMNDRMVTEDQSILNEKNVDQFEDLMDRFKFLAKQGAFMGEEKGPSIGEQLNNLRKKVMKDIRKVTGGKVDDGVYSLGFGINVVNPLSKKGRNIIKNTAGNLWNTVFGSKNDKDKKTEKSDIEKINEVVKSQLEENEKQFQDAGGISLGPDSEELKNYLRTKTELEKLQERIKKEPLKVVAEFMAAANPSSVSAQTTMLSVDVSGVGGSSGFGTKEQRAMLDAIAMAEGTTASYGTIYGGNVVPELARGELTINEVLEMQRTGMVRGRNVGYAVDQHNSDATGKHQFMSYVLKEEMQKQGISGDTLFTPELQDQMILSRISGYRGVTPELLAKEGMSDKVIDMLAPEFASFPNLFGPDFKGRDIQGTSFYGQGGKSAQSIRDAFNKSLNSSDPMGDRSSLNPDKPNMIAQFAPEGYMPYDDPAGSPPQIIALSPQLQTTQAGVVATGSGGNDSPQVMPITDVGVILSQIQLNNLART